MRWIAAVVIGLVFLGGAADGRAEEVKSPRGCAITMPDHWRVASAQEEAIAKKAAGAQAKQLDLLILGPVRNDFCDNVSVILVPMAIPINEATEKASATQLAAMLGKKAEELHSKRLQIQGRTALSFAMEKPAGPNGPLLRVWLVYLPGKEQTYLFTCTTLSSRWEELWPVFKKIVYTARIDVAP